MTEKKFGIYDLILSINGEEIKPVPPEVLVNGAESLEVEFKDFTSMIAFYFRHIDGRDYGKTDDLHCRYCGKVLYQGGKALMFCCDRIREEVLFDQRIRKERKEKLKDKPQEDSEEVLNFRILLNESELEGWEQGVTFKTYLPKTPVEEAVKKACKDFAEDETKVNLILSGKVGTGKTHLACATAKWLGFYKQKSFLIFRCSSVSTVENMERYKTVDTLIIDDIGRETGSESRISARVGVISEIIEYRHRNARKTIFTMNLNSDELAKKYGSHIVDRIIDKAVIPERIEFESNRGQA